MKFNWFFISSFKREIQSSCREEPCSTKHERYLPKKIVASSVQRRDIHWDAMLIQNSYRIDEKKSIYYRTHSFILADSLLENVDVHFTQLKMTEANILCPELDLHILLFFLANKDLFIVIVKNIYWYNEAYSIKSFE